MAIRRTTLLPRLLAAGVLLRGAASLGAQADTARLPNVVVTATRLPVPAADVPASVSVLTGDQLRLQGITNVGDALRQIPGVTMAQSGSFGGATSLFLRGGESKYVKVLVDGVPMNDPGGAFDFGSLTTDNVDRIEIVRGPASVLYGADAMTGVVQIFTRAGDGAPRAEVSARAGSYGSADADAALLGGLPGGGYSIDVAHHQTTGIYAFNNAYRNTVASSLVRLQPDAQTELQVMLRYREDNYHYPTNGGGTPVDSNAFDSQDETTAGLTATRTLSSWANAQLAIDSHETTGGTSDTPNGSLTSTYVSLDHIRRRSAEARVNLAVAPDATLTLGGQAEQEDENTQSQYMDTGYQSNSVFSTSRNNEALYGQILATVAHSATLTGGARYDQNERFGAFGTYRLGGTWRLLADTRLRASTGTAFREPTFTENYSTSFTTGNPNLRPERSNSWEVGVEQDVFDGRLTLGATHFAQRFQNLIDYTGDTASCGASYCNVAQSRADGQEFQIIGRISPNVTGDANLTHLDTRVLTPGFDTTANGLYLPGQQLIRRPRTSWNAGLTYHVAQRGALDVRVLHVGDRIDRDYSGYPAVAVVNPAYTRTDVGGELALASPAAGSPRVTLHIENALGVTYQDVYGFQSPGRVAMAGLRWAF